MVRLNNVFLLHLTALAFLSSQVLAFLPYEGVSRRVDYHRHPWPHKVAVPTSDNPSANFSRRKFALFAALNASDKGGERLSFTDRLVAFFLWRPAQPLSKVVDRVFANADSNNDGRVDLSETYELVLKMYVKINQAAPIPPPNKEVIKVVFEYSDVNDDGTIDRKEFVGLMRILMSRALWRLISFKSVSLVGAPLLTEYLVRLFRRKRWLFEFVQSTAPPFLQDIITSSAFWRTLVLVFLINTLGGMILGLVNWLLDYSKYVNDTVTSLVSSDGQSKTETSSN